MSVSAILLCGGSGSRMKSTQPKQFLNLFGKPLFLYAFEALLDHSDIKEIVIAYKEGTREALESIVERLQRPLPSLQWVVGGNTRQQSVFNALKCCRFPVVLLHESARPLVGSKTVGRILAHPAKALTLGIEIPFTVLQKNESNEISALLKRESLFNVQLPQKFPTQQLLAAHRRALEAGKEYTDDSSLYFDGGFSCAVVEGSSQNMKITRPEDIKIGEEILRMGLEDL